MKTLNPFVPTVSLIVVPPRSRRERFKAGVITVLLAHAIVLIGLLIQGCRTESSAVSTDPSLAAAGAVAEQGTAGQAPGAVPARQSSVQAGASSQVSSAAQVAPAQVSATRSPSANADAYYVIKPGDTLARVARAHGTTVKAIKLANGISSDALTVGQKLKIPTTKA